MDPIHLFIYFFTWMFTSDWLFPKLLLIWLVNNVYSASESIQIFASKLLHLKKK